MKVAKISDVQNLASGERIDEITVKVKKVFPSRPAKGNPVGCILSDKTGEIKATFWDVPVRDLEGKQITLKNVTVKFSDYNQTKELSINSRTGVFEQNGQSATGIAASESQQLVSRTAHLAPKTKADARLHIFNTAKLYLECLKATEWLQQQFELSPEQFQAATASLFISADRAGLSPAFADEAKPESKPEPKAKQEEPAEDEDELKW